MGKIADRFAHKRHPLFPVSIELLKDAEKYMEIAEQEYSEDDEDIFDPDYEKYEKNHEQFGRKMEQVLKDFSNPDFCKLQELLELNATARPDGESEFELLRDGWETLSTHYESEKNPHALGLLVAIPVATAGKRPAWELDITQSRSIAITEAFQKYDLLGEDVSVCYLPRIMSLVECSILDPQVLYHMRNALRKGNNREAYRLAMQKRMEMGAGLPGKEEVPPGTVFGSTGVLVAYIESPTGIISPVGLQLYGGRDDDADGEESAAFTNKTSEDFSDAMALGNKACADLVGILNLESLLLIDVPNSWGDSLSHALHVERTSKFLFDLKSLGLESEDLGYLESNQDVFIPEGSSHLEVKVKDSRKEAWLTLHWQCHFQETLEDAVIAFFGYIEFLKSRKE